ncbi:MAG: right-handed parallel beta-helix repeat-containing protein [Ferruginibacter sp.]
MIIAGLLQTLYMTSNKPVLLLLFFFATFALCCKQQPVFSQQQKVYDLVKDFKAVPDDKTDNYMAFVKAAETLSSAGGGHLNIPEGKYYIAVYKILGGDEKNNVSDIVFKNCNNLTITGNNSVIRVNGKFLRDKDYKLRNLPYNYAYKNTVCPFTLMNCKNVLLKDITLYGEVDKMKKTETVVEGQSYGIFVFDKDSADVSSNIVFQNITAHHFAADGFLIRSNGKNIMLNNCRSNNNARQGLSIVKGNRIKVLNCVFDSTGKTGAYGWHAPAAGIDVENEFGPGKLNDVLIRNCTIRGNRGFQIVTTLPGDKVVIDSCFISDLNAGYSRGLNGVGMYSLNSTISNSIIFASIQVDIADQKYKGPAVQEINKNIIYSGNRGIISATFSRPVNITDNIFVMLPNPYTDTYFPYIQNVNATFNRNIVVVHADRIKQKPNLVTALVQQAKEVKDNIWLINGYDIPKEKQKSVFFIPASNGSKLVENQFFAASDYTARYKIPQKNILSETQVSRILSKELFTAYEQTGYNRKYIEEALALRKYAKEISAAANR